MECEDCEGTGAVVVIMADTGKYAFNRCPICLGTGRVDPRNETTRNLDDEADEDDVPTGRSKEDAVNEG
ncbi:MAG: hypothetical protein IMZ62_12965 [Chloroflexi bacterium]|nr:hypothetical protein [Chloroflexota bacterium]MBE3118189.1 hypothetical protein [Candidatus Atribacteria bacterium]